MIARQVIGLVFFQFACNLFTVYWLSKPALAPSGSLSMLGSENRTFNQPDSDNALLSLCIHSNHSSWSIISDYLVRMLAGSCMYYKVTQGDSCHQNCPIVVSMIGSWMGGKILVPKPDGKCNQFCGKTVWMGEVLIYQNRAAPFYLAIPGPLVTTTPISVVSVSHNQVQTKVFTAVMTGQQICILEHLVGISSFVPGIMLDFDDHQELLLVGPVPIDTGLHDNKIWEPLPHLHHICKHSSTKHGMWDERYTHLIDDQREYPLSIRQKEYARWSWLIDWLKGIWPTEGQQKTPFGRKDAWEESVAVIVEVIFIMDVLQESIFCNMPHDPWNLVVDCFDRRRCFVSRVFFGVGHWMNKRRGFWNEVNGEAQRSWQPSFIWNWMFIFLLNNPQQNLQPQGAQKDFLMKITMKKMLIKW